MDNGKMSRCRSCGAMIVWIQTKGGRNMPCNSTMVNYLRAAGGSQKIVTPQGEVVTADIVPADQAEGIGYISHFATCPNAARHRIH